MPSPIWVASPPEVHSSLLSAGPGAGPLLVAAEAWTALAAAYNSTAEELTAVLGAVQSGAWMGPSAEAFVAANGPYLAWLLRTAAEATATAAAHQTAATAYTSALAAMPTMAELAANHATRAALISTNFLGINTIPIALNEADYARMWAQAAAVMTAYEATANASVASVPPTEAAPAVLKTPASADPVPRTASEPPQWFTDFAKWLDGLVPQASYPDSSQYPLYTELQEFFTSIGYTGIPDPLADFFAGLQSGSNLLPPIGVPGSWLGWTGNPLSYLNPASLAYVFSVPLDPASYIAFTTQVIVSDLIAVMYTALFNPQALGVVIPLVMVEIVGSTIGNTIQLINYTLTQTALLPALVPALAATTALAPVGVVGGLGVGALAHHVTTEAAVPPPSPPAPPSAGLAMAQPPTSAPAPTPSSAPAPTPTTTPAPTPAPAPAPPPTPAGPPPAAMSAYGYLVGGLNMDARRAAGATSTRKKGAPKPAAEDADAAEPTEEGVAPQPRRRRTKAGMHGRGHEYMDLDQELTPDPVAAPSDRGAGTIGRAGAVQQAGTAPPAGLTTLAADQFGGNVVSPMLPNTWSADGANS